ncbi:MAG: aminoacyl-tRNA deacylase [Bradymonadales bacterium]|nr:aminoacyl-tRNA deacylase [Bradymonadales bacterium]
MSSLGERALAQRGIRFTSHEYDYRKKGADAASHALQIALGAMLKTLVVQVGDGGFVFVLVPGDRSLSMRALARALGVKQAELASERDAERLTGYRVGGISPFGSRTSLPVYLELTALDHTRLYINGGRRGLILGLEASDLIEAAQAQLIEVGI